MYPAWDLGFTPRPSLSLVKDGSKSVQCNCKLVVFSVNSKKVTRSWQIQHFRLLKLLPMSKAGPAHGEWGREMGMPDKVSRRVQDRKGLILTCY